MSFSIFGLNIPLYGFFFFLGIILAVGVCLFLLKKRKIPAFDFACAAVYTMIGAIIGAKLLYLIVSIGEIVTLFEEGRITLVDIIKGGFVFYGGLIGGAFGVWLYGKQFKMDMKDYFDVFATVLPLGHAFGRVGCYFAGCCWGMKYDGFLSLPAWTNFYDSNTNEYLYSGWGENRLPVQLFEAFFLLLLFGVLMWMFFRKEKRGLNVSVYAISYATWRFFIEFFRGDEGRGVFLLSTSQWISIAIIAFIVLLYCYNKYWKKNKAVAEAKTDPPSAETVETVEMVETVETEIVTNAELPVDDTENE